MKDINFFEPYLNKNTSFIFGEIGKYLVIVGIATPMILYPLYNGWQIYRINSEVATAGLVLNSSKINEAKQAMVNLQNKREEIEGEVELLNRLEKTHQQKNIINDFLMHTINDHIPQEVFLESLRMGQGKIQLQGVGKDKLSIALLENNLRKTEEFKDVFISSIIEDSGNYTFILSFSIKDGDEE